MLLYAICYMLLWLWLVRRLWLLGPVRVRSRSYLSLFAFAFVSLVPAWKGGLVRSFIWCCCCLQVCTKCGPHEKVGVQCLRNGVPVSGTL